ncbi:cyclophilin-like fold protein [Brevibacterium sp. K11IcPPYGO002]|uniref:cyclophilin-like fold protein n=1 Tax=Brevibacterium sp. K11IcPPYGO002 TaxID=3058837 RepID=UPI003D818AC7
MKWTSNTSRRTLLSTISILIATGLLAGCTDGPEEGGAPVTPSTSTSHSAGETGDAGSSVQAVEGTVVRFTAGSASVDVTIGQDSPATRDFVAMLPMTLELEEFNGREKIADLPRELDYEGSPGSDPEDGDLIFFVPWGNIGFYYNTDGIGYSDDTLHLGTFKASDEELSRFEGQSTTVESIE